ncbi:MULTISPECIES: MFS transporter [Enterococcus]|uniref:Major facilitator superfamily (MFS) profile domain-containing protein n=1 Tax=Candidatus Enterococcus ferrettii TaxID=2815324 RepID=A0ABV0EN17_9ENTE|nr:MFS transporter [Enterococcus sp. 665A]MBO1338466.1 MFS transporter [Enterococcus sp. 665A]
METVGTEVKLKKNLVTLLVLTLSGSFIYTLPYFRSYYYDGFMKAFNLTNAQMGLCSVCFGGIGAISYLFGGIISDRFSIKLLIPTSMILTGTLGFCLLFSPPPAIVILIHALWGLTSLMMFYPALMKSIRALAGSTEQGKAFGIFEGGRGIFNAGYLTIAAVIFARMVAAGSESLGIRRIILFYATVTTLLGVLTIFLLRDLPEENSGEKKSFQLKLIAKPAKIPEVWLMIGIIFSTLTVSQGYYYISPYVTNTFTVSAVVGVILTSASQYIRPFASMGAGFLGDRINSSKVMLIGQVGLFIGVATILVCNSMGIIPVLIASLIIFVCMYFCVSMHFAIMEEFDCPPEWEGAAIGLICCLGYMPEVTNHFIAGQLLDHFPGNTGYRLFFIYMLVVVAIGIGLTLIWFKRTKQKRMSMLKNNQKLKGLKE